MPSRFRALSLGVACALVASSARVARANDELLPATATVLMFFFADLPLSLARQLVGV